jgi:Subtilase family
LIVLATGNIRDGIVRNTYLNRNDTEPVENPAQAWNALTVGAFTEKVLLTDPGYGGVAAYRSSRGAFAMQPHIGYLGSAVADQTRCSF